VPDEPPLLPDPVTPLAASASAVTEPLASPGHVHTAGSTHCQNCGTELKGPFCHACGQHDFDVNRSFWHTFLEALENLFHFDGKFFRNIVTLLFQPGRLSAAFNAGRRASQVPPLRLYVFTAFVFFLWAFSGDRAGEPVQYGPPNPAGMLVDGRPVEGADVLRALSDPAYAERLRSAAEAADQTKAPSAAPAGDPAGTLGAAVAQAGQEVARVAAEQRAEAANRPNLSYRPLVKPEGERNDFERWADRQGRRLSDPAFRHEVGERFVAAVPKMLLICLPIFALFTRVLFRKSGQVYLQHLVVAVHFHTFIFLWAMFRDGWVHLVEAVGLRGPAGWLETAANAWFVLYPLLMLRRLYGNPWLRTALKTAVLALAYIAALGIAFVATAAVLFFLM
jgi:hypothetical protein